MHYDTWQLSWPGAARDNHVDELIGQRIDSVVLKR
jgi:hypothetical protein